MTRRAPRRANDSEQEDEVDDEALHSWSKDTSRTSNTRRGRTCKPESPTDLRRPHTVALVREREEKNRWERDARLRGSRKPLGPFPNQGKNLVRNV